MIFKLAYTCGWDSQAGLWQIQSPSGHVLYETSHRMEAAAVCARLNRRFRRPKGAPLRPTLAVVAPRRIANVPGVVGLSAAACG